ncbi:MAG TPA: menaquinone biosynthesis protein [Terriglobia bacterium]|nr:menaquinone biosynthesis protein [Terriglobia bacterium]
MANLRVSVVKYLNTVPLIWGMLHGEQQGRYDLDFTLPANCADAVRQRRADLGIIPAIEYHRMDHVEILSGLSIASKGAVRSVLLLSKVPLQKIQSVALDNSSRTSAALVRILMRKFYCRFVTLQPAAPRPDDMLKRADAALLIGDPALTYSREGLEVFDLAEEWKKHTGLPFVFALWVGQQELRLSRYRRDFELSRDFGLAHIEDIANEYAPKLKMSVDEVRVYLTQNIDYSLDEENRKGLRLFGRLARELGIIPTEKELMFV